MWARHVELALGLWLLAGPLVFEHATIGLWIHDVAAGALVAAIALASQRRPRGMLHLLALPIAAWLVAAGWWSTWQAGGSSPPIFQNRIVVGLLLAMFAIVPNHASRPPEALDSRERGRTP